MPRKILSNEECNGEDCDAKHDEICFAHRCAWKNIDDTKNTFFKLPGFRHCACNNEDHGWHREQEWNVPEKEEYLIRYLNKSSVRLDTIAFSKDGAELVVDNLLRQGIEIDNIQVWTKVVLSTKTTVPLG